MALVLPNLTTLLRKRDNKQATLAILVGTSCWERVGLAQNLFYGTQHECVATAKESKHRGVLLGTCNCLWPRKRVHSKVAC